MGRKKNSVASRRVSVRLSAALCPRLFAWLINEAKDDEGLGQIIRQLVEEALLLRELRSGGSLQLVDLQQFLQEYVANYGVDKPQKTENKQKTSLIHDPVNERFEDKQDVMPVTSGSEQSVVNIPTPLITKKYSGAAELARRMVANGLIKR